MKYSFLYVCIGILCSIAPSIVADHDLYMVVSHGFGDDHMHAKFNFRYLYPSHHSAQARDDMTQQDAIANSSDFWTPIYAVDFQDQKTPTKSHLGQGDDILRLKNLVKKKIGFNKFIGIGHSRGGAALISYTAEHNPTGLQGLILCGTPASIPDVVANKLFGMKSLANALLKRFSKYAFDQTPQQAIKNINNKEILIVILHHTNDNRVRLSHAQRLYTEFCTYNFKNVYLIPIEQGNHKDGITHKEYTILNNIYRIHGLAYDQTVAIINEKRLQKLYQPFVA